MRPHGFKAWGSEYYSSRDDGLRRAGRDPDGRDFSNCLVNDSLVSRYSGPHIGRVEDMTGYGGRETWRDKAPYRVKHAVDGAVGAIGGMFDVVELHDMDRIIRVFKEARDTGELNRIGAIAPESPSPAPLLPFSDPRHHEHALYADAQGRFPDLSEARLHQVTAEMHKIGMQLGRNGDAIERNGTVWGSRIDLPGARFGIDLSGPEPSVQQTMQDVRQHDQAEQQRIAQYRQQEMARGQSGPVMG